MKKYIALLVLPFIFAGCGVVGTVEEFGCGFVSGKDQDHCYQDAAKRKDSFETCAKIKAETFSALEGPATRDKCYLQVAEKTGDASGCEKIEGGMISYTKEECVNSVFEKKLSDMQTMLDAAGSDENKLQQAIKEQQELNEQMQKYNQYLSDVTKSMNDTQKALIQNLR